MNQLNSSENLENLASETSNVNQALGEPQAGSSLKFSKKSDKQQFALEAKGLPAILAGVCIIAMIVGSAIFLAMM